jgi:hypothetical protein
LVKNERCPYLRDCLMPLRNFDFTILPFPNVQRSSIKNLVGELFISLDVMRLS